MAKVTNLKETPEHMAYLEVVNRIAGNIGSLAKAVEALLNGELNRRALIILLANSSGQNQNTVGSVLKALETLEKDWLKK